MTEWNCIQRSCTRIENETKYGLTKEVDFAIVLLKNGQKIMILKCIRCITKKSVVFERFIITLKTKIYKYMTPVSENVYIHKIR